MHTPSEYTNGYSRSRSSSNKRGRLINFYMFRFILFASLLARSQIKGTCVFIGMEALCAYVCVCVCVSALYGAYVITFE